MHTYCSTISVKPVNKDYALKYESSRLNNRFVMYCTRQGKHMDLIVDKKFRRHPKRKIQVYIPDVKPAKMSIPRTKLCRKSSLRNQYSKYRIWQRSFRYYIKLLYYSVIQDY